MFKDLDDPGMRWSEMSAASQRQDTFVVGEIASGSQFVIIAGLASPYGSSNRSIIPSDAQLYLPTYFAADGTITWQQGLVDNPLGQIIPYATIGYTSTTDSSFEVTIAFYSSPSLNSLIGYYNGVETGFSVAYLSTTPVTFTITTTYPTYDSSSILAGVPYQLNLYLYDCGQYAANGLCSGSGSSNEEATVNAIFLPYQWYSVGSCNLSNPSLDPYFSNSNVVPLAVSYQQCFLIDPSTSYYTSSSCIGARNVVAYSDLASCQQYSDADRYYYALDACGQSFTYTDLRAISVTPNTSLGICDSGSCNLETGLFTCQTSTTPPPSNNGGSTPPGNGDTNNPDPPAGSSSSSSDGISRWLIILGVGLVILIIVVVIGVLIYNSTKRPVTSKPTASKPVNKSASK